MARSEKTSKLVLTALMMCLVLLATIAIRIPAPFTQGYVHLGDTMIFISVLLLGKNMIELRKTVVKNFEEKKQETTGIKEFFNKFLFFAQDKNK